VAGGVDIGEGLAVVVVVVTGGFVEGETAGIVVVFGGVVTVVVIEGLTAGGDANFSATAVAFVVEVAAGEPDATLGAGETEGDDAPFACKEEDVEDGGEAPSTATRLAFSLFASSEDAEGGDVTGLELAGAEAATAALATGDAGVATAEEGDPWLGLLLLNLLIASATGDAGFAAADDGLGGVGEPFCELSIFIRSLTDGDVVDVGDAVDDDGFESNRFASSATDLVGEGVAEEGLVAGDPPPLSKARRFAIFSSNSESFLSLPEEGVVALGLAILLSGYRCLQEFGNTTSTKLLLSTPIALFQKCDHYLTFLPLVRAVEAYQVESMPMRKPPFL